MPILDLEHRLREVGRIRLGDSEEAVTAKGKTYRRPVKLSTFRLTARDEQIIRRAADLYGGTAEPWPEQDGQWQVTTDATDLEVIVPPAHMSFSQWYEEWSGGGCVRRCDGRHDVIRDCPCDCDPVARVCAIHTRLSVMLPDLPGLGVWRVETQGYYAAVELGGAVEIAGAAAARGQMLPARLRIEQREVLRAGKKLKFAAPVLDLDVAPAALLAGPDGTVAGELTGENMPADMPALDRTTGEITAGAGDTPTPERPSPTAPPTTHPDRTCSRCGSEYGDGALIKGGDGESRFVHRDCPTATASDDGPPRSGLFAGRTEELDDEPF